MAKLSCSSRALQYILFGLNFLFWICGAILLGIGIWILVSTQSAVQFLHIPNLNFGLLHAAGVTLIVVGTLIFLVGGLGCCGACSENGFCLSAFSVILVLLVILQIIAIILAGTMHNKLVHELGKLLSVSMNNYGNENFTVETNAWNYLQIELKCCGVMQPEDWNGTLWFRNQPNSSVVPVVPQSCCVPLVDPKNYSVPIATNANLCYASAYASHDFPNRSENVNIKGCEASLDDWFVESAAVLIGVTVFVIIVQIVIVIMACVLKSKLSHPYEYV